MEIRLTHVSGLLNPYAIFDEIKDKKFDDFAVVKATIEDLTNKVAGSNKVSVFINKIGDS